MNTALLGIGLDILILFFLVATIYVALRLSKSINAFRAYRHEFKGLIKELNSNIDRAQQVIEEMKNSGQRATRDSGALIDELKMMNDTGNALAERLENLVEKGRYSVRESAESRSEFSGLENIFADEDDAPEMEDSILRGETERNIEKNTGRDRDTGKRDAVEEFPPAPSFFIQDREYDKPYDDNLDVDDDKPFKSQAEKELFEALQGHKKKKPFGF